MPRVKWCELSEQVFTISEPQNTFLMSVISGKKSLIRVYENCNARSRLNYTTSKLSWPPKNHE